jgi:hypothetical protein
MMPDTRRAHWEAVYQQRPLDRVSWYQAYPTRSMALIRASGVSTEEALIDVGGGASFLVDTLLQDGFKDVTVLDISSTVLDRVRERLGKFAANVSLIPADVTTFAPSRRYALWHDRAVFHFLTTPEDRARYVRVLDGALTPNGQLILAAFGPEGPERCSGLPVARYSALSLSVALGSAWSLEQSSLEEHRTPAGTAQQFIYALFRRKSTELIRPL